MTGGIVGAVIFFLSSTVFQYFRIFGVVFNSGIVMTVLFALRSDRKNTLIATVVYGSLVDLYASRLLGVNLLIYLAVALMMLHLADNLYRESVTLPYLLLFLATAAYHAVYLPIMILFRIPIFFQQIPGVFLAESIYNIAVGIGIYYLILKFMKGKRND